MPGGKVLRFSRIVIEVEQQRCLRRSVRTRPKADSAAGILDEFPWTLPNPKWAVGAGAAGDQGLARGLRMRLSEQRRQDVETVERRGGGEPNTGESGEGG